MTRQNKQILRKVRDMGIEKKNFGRVVTEST